MKVVRLLALRRIRLQPMRAVLAALVVGAGTSLVVTILVLSGSLTTSVNSAARALAGPAPLRVLGPLQRGGISTDDLAAIRAVDGVQAAVPLVQSITQVDPGGDEDDIAVTVLGFDCSIEALFGSLGGQCTDEGLATLTTPFIGSKLAAELHEGADVRTNLGRLPLAGAVALDPLDRINDGRVVAMPMPLALTELGREGRVDIVYVTLAPGEDVGAAQDRITAALPDDYRVLGALDPPPVVGVVFATFLPLFTVIAILTLGIGAVLVRNSITLSLEERRRQTAIVGALGGSRWLLVGGTVVEVVVLGAIGGLVGVGAGIALAGPVSGGLDEILRRLAGVPLEVHVPASAVVVGVLLGVGVAVLSAVGPARRAVRVDVAAELASRGNREEAVSATSFRRVAVALVTMGAGVALTRISGVEAGIDKTRAQVGPLGFVISAIGAVAFVAVGVPLLLSAIERLSWLQRSDLRLAVSNLRREARRSAVMAIAIGFAMGVGFITSSFKLSVTEAIRDQLTGNFTGVQVSSIDPNNSAGNESRLGPELLAQLAALPGVDGVEQAGFVILGNEAKGLIGVQAYTNAWVDTKVAAGHFDQAGLDRGEVALGPALARSTGLRPGESVTLSTPKGPVQLPIMGVLYDGSFGGRNVQMSYDLMLDLYGPQSPVSVILQPEAGVSPEELEATVRKANLDPDLVIEGFDEVLDRNAEAVKTQLSTFDAIQRGLLLMSFVAVLSTLLLVGIQRQKEFGMLAAVGMTPAELRRMVLSEAGIVAVLAVIVTGLGSLVMYYALNSLVPVIIGYSDPFVLDVPSYFAYSGIAVVTALLAALYPARRAARVEVLDALRYE